MPEALSMFLSSHKRFVKNEWELMIQKRKDNLMLKVLGEDETLGEGLSLQGGEDGKTF